jgi:hypothetical protein
MTRKDSDATKQTRPGAVPWPLGYLPDSEKPASPGKIEGYDKMTFEQRRAAQWKRQGRA